MATVDRPPVVPPRTSSTTQQKTIYNLLSNLNTTTRVVKVNSEQVESDDIVILRRDPTTNQTTINKTAYKKLHTNSSSPNRNSSIDKIKETFEQSDDNIQEASVDSAKDNITPVPRVRRSRLTRSQVIVPVKKQQRPVRFSLNIDKGSTDVNSNNLKNKEDLSSDEEYVTIVRRSDSEESVFKIEKELSAFTIDPNMEKKKKNSFRKIFSVFSNKDKKKKGDDKNKAQNKDNAGMYSENYQNESNNFSRHAPFRHTTGGENHSARSPATTVQRSDSDVKVPNPYFDQKIEKEYAEKHINQFNQFKQNFESVSSQNNNPGGTDRYTPMDKPIIKNAPTGTYMNMPGIRKFIDTSSSASTLESDKSNVYKSEGHIQLNQGNTDSVDDRNYTNSMGRLSDTKRDTPPRLLETKQDLRLVNPKAIIPINSERALPNPYKHAHSKSSEAQKSIRNDGSYQNTKFQTDSLSTRPNLNETYGTVFDSLENRPSYITSNKISPRGQEKVPRSPSLEPSKLKLPPNREIIPLSPRVRSPVPPDNSTTEKIIATELLKTKRSPTPTKKLNKDVMPSHQRFETDIDYPDNIQHISRDNLLKSADNLFAKPPVGNRQIIRAPIENGRMEYDNRLSQASPSTLENLYRLSKASPVGSTDRIVTNAQVHINSPTNRTPTPNNSTQNLSLTPIRSNGTGRPLTPSGMRMPESPRTPQKEDMRKSVEAYYWKEIKKLKDQENYDLYLLQMQYGNLGLYNYPDDQVSVRRSRSLSPSANRNSRRSLSLPRDVKGQGNVVPDKRYYPNPIPENQVVNHQIHPRSIQQLQFQQNQQKYFNRAAPERRTVDGNTKTYENTTGSLYRPIFKRGSLSMPAQQVMDDSLKRKVSFSGASDQNVQSWPTKNGFTKSPPQRRIDKAQHEEDDVFLTNTPKRANDNKFNYITNSRIDPAKDELYYNTKQHLVGPNGEPFYVSRSNQNPYYMPQKQIAEGPYGQRVIIPEDGLYGQPRDAILPQSSTPRLVRHGSIQINEELYPQRTASRKISYQNSNVLRPSVASTPNQEVQYVSRAPSQTQLRREIILKDEIFGQFGGYVPSQEPRVVQPQSMYSSRQSIAEYPQSRTVKQVYVNNKVCDIYGQIHDADSGRPVQQSGVIMGQLQRNPGSPQVVRNSYSQLPGREPFVRNSRLTASANDMYHRNRTVFQYPPESLYGKIDLQGNGNDVLNRPLPPVPQGRKGMQRNLMISDTESISDASEINRIMSNVNKPRVIYGK